MKKRLFQVLVFASIFSMNSLLMCEMLAVGDVAVAPLVDNSGHDRIVNIVSQVKHDVVPGNDEPIAYVQVSNIDQDLNIKEIAHFIGCDTVMGYTSIVENLQRPVSPIDESGIVELRKNVIQQLVDNPELKKEVEALLKIAADQEKVVIELLSNSFKSETCPELQELELLKKKNPTSYAFQNENLTNQGWHELCFVGNGLLSAGWYDYI